MISCRNTHPRLLFLSFPPNIHSCYHKFNGNTEKIFFVLFLTQHPYSVKGREKCSSYKLRQLSTPYKYWYFQPVRQKTLLTKCIDCFMSSGDLRGSTRSAWQVLSKCHALLIKYAVCAIIWNMDCCKRTDERNPSEVHMACLPMENIASGCHSIR